MWRFIIIICKNVLNFPRYRESKPKKRPRRKTQDKTKTLSLRLKTRPRHYKVGLDISEDKAWGFETTSLNEVYFMDSASVSLTLMYLLLDKYGPSVVTDQFSGPLSYTKHLGNTDFAICLVLIYGFCTPSYSAWADVVNCCALVSD